LLDDQPDRSGSLNLPVVGTDEWHTCLQPSGKLLRGRDVDCVQRSDCMSGDDLFGALQNFCRHGDEVPLRAIPSELLQCRREAGAFDYILRHTPAQGPPNLDGQNGGGDYLTLS
jgi:hypothetical protein